MIQVKEFRNDTSLGNSDKTAERKCNLFLKTLKPEQYVDIKYAVTTDEDGIDYPYILLIYKTL